MIRNIVLILFLSLQVHAEESGSATTVALAEMPPAASAIAAPATESTEPVMKAEIKDESQIPLKVATEKKDEVSGSSLQKFLLGSVVLSCLLIGIYFLLRKYSIRSQKTDSHQIKMLTQHHLGPRKSLAIIRVAGESILIGVTDHNISMIKSLSLLDEDIPQDTPKKFDQTLFQVEKKSDEEFTIKGIHEHVRTKLKEMKGFS